MKHCVRLFGIKLLRNVNVEVGKLQMRTEDVPIPGRECLLMAPVIVDSIKLIPKAQKSKRECSHRHFSCFRTSLKMSVCI